MDILTERGQHQTFAFDSDTYIISSGAPKGFRPLDVTQRRTRNYAPTVFAKDKLARQRKIKKADFEARWCVNRDRRRQTYHWRILKFRVSNCRGSPRNRGDNISICRRYRVAASVLPALAAKTFQSRAG
jgi:hypothetical protein